MSTPLHPYAIRELPSSYDPGFFKYEHQAIQRSLADFQTFVANAPVYNPLDYVPKSYIQGTTDISASIQKAIDTAPDYSTVLLPGFATPYKVTGAPTISGRNGLQFMAFGATIQLSGAGAQGLRFAGATTNNDIGIYGLRVLGSGVVGDDHQGFGTILNNGAMGENLRFFNCTAKNCVRGFYVESSVTNWRDVGFTGCRAINMVGTASGQGDGFVCSSILGVQATDCYADLCQRHSFYDANNQQLSIRGMTFRRHRQGVSTNQVVSALVLVRRSNADIGFCHFIDCEDTALSIESDESDVNQPMGNINVGFCDFTNSIHRDIVIGTSAAATSGQLSGVKLSHLGITRTEAATNGIESIRIFNGKRITISHIDFKCENAYTVQKSLIVVGTAAIASSFIDRLKIKDITGSVTVSGGGSAYLCELAAPICTGTSRVTIESDELDLNGGAGGSVVYDAGRTNTNIKIQAGDLPDSQTTIEGPDWTAQSPMSATGFKVREGTNARMGTAVLIGGTVVVPTTKVTANSRIFLSGQIPGGTPGGLNVSARTPGTSFTITSTNGADTSTVAWEIKEPAV